MRKTDNRHCQYQYNTTQGFANVNAADGASKPIRRLRLPGRQIKSCRADDVDKARVMFDGLMQEYFGVKE